MAGRPECLPPRPPGREREWKQCIHPSSHHPPISLSQLHPCKGSTSTGRFRPEASAAPALMLQHKAPRLHHGEAFVFRSEASLKGGSAPGPSVICTLRTLPIQLWYEWYVSCTASFRIFSCNPLHLYFYVLRLLLCLFPLHFPSWLKNRFLSSHSTQFITAIISYSRIIFQFPFTYRSLGLARGSALGCYSTQNT